MKVLGYFLFAVIGAVGSVAVTVFSFCTFSFIVSPTIFEEAEWADRVLLASPLIVLTGAGLGMLLFWATQRRRSASPTH